MKHTLRSRMQTAINACGQITGAALSSGGVTKLTRDGLGRILGESNWWQRKNFRGEPISLLEGPALTVGLVAGGVAGAANPRSALSATIATAGAGAFGIIDDLFETTETRARGLRGHIGALRAGTVTTGLVKIVGIGTSALVASAVMPPRHRGIARIRDIALDTALIAGTANLVNLFDLRPGRALKVSAVMAVPLLGTEGRAEGAAVLAAVIASAPHDLAARDMAGDGGANALGAIIGHGVARGATTSTKLLVLLGVVGLTLASERMSFSKVIAGNPLLRALDNFGRPTADTEGTSSSEGDATLADDTGETAPKPVQDTDGPHQ